MERAGYAELGTGETRYIQAEVAVSILAREDSVIRLITQSGYMRLGIQAGQTLTLGPLYLEGIYVESGRVAVYYAPGTITLSPATGNLDVPLSTRASEATLQDVLSRLDIRMSEAPILTPYPLTPSSVKFEGSWIKAVDSDSPSGFHFYSNAAGARIHVWFHGKRFAVAFHHGPNRGIANIYVDGNQIDSVDLYDTTYYWRQYYYEADQDGLHELVIEVSGEKNPSSTDYYVVIGGLYFEGRKNINTPYIYYLKYIYDINVSRLNAIPSTETTTPLPAGAEFVGGWHDSGYPAASYVVITVYADTDMDVYVEQSHNASTIIRSDRMSYTANSVTGNMLKVQLMGRYWRVRAVNTSNTDQTKLVITRRYAFA